MEENFPIEIAYAPAPPEVPIIMRITISPGTTIGQALIQSAIASSVLGCDLSLCKVGVWGKLTTLDAPVPLQARIEIYRPLLADPKESRRRRSKNG